MIEIIIAMLMSWEKVFLQKRTAKRAIRQAMSQVSVIGRKTIARSYLVRAETGDWSSEYKLHSRSEWKEADLFNPVIKSAIEISKGKFLVLALDDTRIKKTGKQILACQWGRDAMSPPFHINLEYGIRFLHIAAIIQQSHKEISSRALPVLFKEVTPIKKPGKKASPDELKKYKAEIKLHNLCQVTVQEIKEMRKKVDSLAGKEKTLAVVMDGSFCNKTIFKQEYERTILLARTRKDSKLCYRAEGRKTYSTQKFTPEDVKANENQQWKEDKVFYGAKFRKVEYKEVNQVLWQRGAGNKNLRLLVIRPMAYRRTKKGRLLYRQAAYLLTTDLNTPAVELLQMYFDRWEIEVAHKELKQYFGLGQAQVRVSKSVSRQPSLTVSTYSIMHLASILAFGSHRTDDFGSLPPYQRDKSRVSAIDLIHFLRNEAINKPELFPFSLNISAQSLLASASC